MAVGGFLPNAKKPSFDGYFPLPAHLPVLSIIGKNDIVVTPEKSQSLVDGSLNSRVEFHDGGEAGPYDSKSTAHYQDTLPPRKRPGAISYSASSLPPVGRVY